MALYFAGLIEHAQVKGLGVQVDSAVKWVLLVVESCFWTETPTATIQGGHDEYPSLAPEPSMTRLLKS